MINSILKRLLNKNEALKEKLAAVSPEERGRWKSKATDTRERIYELSREIATLDPATDTPGSFKNRLTALNQDLSNEMDELVEFNLDKDEAAALALIEILTEQASLASR